jgi:hypothetical protein
MADCAICGKPVEDGHGHQVTSVGGIEKFPMIKPDVVYGVEYAVVLSVCPFCGHPAVYCTDRRPTPVSAFQYAVRCSNNSCAVQTPFHYRDKDSARAAWNRRATVGKSEGTK